MKKIPDVVCLLENVSLVYRAGEKNVAALSDIDIAFEKGSFWAIMGGSGAGKSSLLNILGCLCKTSAGCYYIDDQEVSRLEDNQLSELRLKRLGFVFQSFHLIPQLNVLENIELPLSYLDREHRVNYQRAQELAIDVGLADRLDHLPNELSGGEQQRVAVARAMVNNPTILLADEPTGNLDSSTSEQIMRLLASLNQKGTTIIMVTHDETTSSWASNKLYLRDGKIETILP